MVQDIAKNLSEGKQVDAILLDFSKAFDKVPHERSAPKTSPLWNTRAYTAVD
jgi:hypothetical protein